MSGNPNHDDDLHDRTLAVLRDLTGRMPRDVWAGLVALDHAEDFGCAAHDNGQTCCLDTVTAAAAEALRTSLQFTGHHRPWAPPAPGVIERRATLTDQLAAARAGHELMLADLGDLLRAVGMFAGARPESPHQLMQLAIGAVRHVADVERARIAEILTGWRVTVLLARYQPVPSPVVDVADAAQIAALIAPPGTGALMPCTECGRLAAPPGRQLCPACGA